MPFTFKNQPKLLPEEKIVHYKKRLWLLSAKSLPSYQLQFPLLPLIDIALFITDRRILLAAKIFMIYTQEFSMWYEQKVPAGENEIIRNVTTGTGLFGVPYLEINTENNGHSALSWLRSPKGRIRCFMKDAQAIYAMIMNKME